MFDLVVVAKALVQFEHSSEVLVFDLDASLEATMQFEQATEAVELMLEHCLRLRLDECLVAFGHAGAAMLPSNMVDASHTSRYLWFRGDVTSLRVIPFCNH
jgi:hypothetical protein